MKIFLVIVIGLISFMSEGQTVNSAPSKKILETKFSAASIVIDGKQDEEAWKNVAVAKDFVMFVPDNGKPIPQNQQTEVKVLYNNDAVYISALLYDDGKILTENTQRDNTGASDFFGCFINGYNDGQGDFRFLVTAADTQLDASAVEGSAEDFSWDAIWESKAIITNFGWSVEMKIPYAALRFSGENKQTWGIQFFRMIKRDNHRYTWNFVDQKQGNFGGQFGILNGITNIKPPVRLFFLPYTSQYFNADANNKTKGTFKGGLDIKYGINDAFTLDVILIPDFGQTAIDQRVLNLGPFEQQFQENRPFFTEGTDLFNKGGLVYSRRIGGRPSARATLGTDEVLEKPVTQSVGLLNAFKISGRTKSGLGVGVLNAITENTYANIINTNNGATRQELVEPISNFNVLVLDQRFNKNSSIAFVNTNVTRNGHFRDANVAALVFDLKNKPTTYGLNGYYKYSYVYNNGKKDGINTGIEFNKISGKYRYGFGGDLIGKHFDPNDLGINFQTNFYDFYGNANYRLLNSTKKLNSLFIGTNFYNEIHKETGNLMTSNFGTRFNATSIKLNSFGGGININPFKTYQYDPRIGVNGASINPQIIGAWCFYSSNYNNKFAVDFNPGYDVFYEKNRTNIDVNLGFRYRFNDKLLLSTNSNYNKRQNDNGFYDKNDNDVIFSYRNILSYNNSLSAKYAPNSKMTFNMSVVHYWSYVENKKAQLLAPNGDLSDYDKPYTLEDEDYSRWNLDLSYNWWFAQGSQVTILYRSIAENGSVDINRNFGVNLDNLLNNKALNHTLSVSIRYFIDYNKITNWF